MQNIDFVIAGFQKCATTSLHFYLQQHPDLFMPDEKEMYYFTRHSEKSNNEDYFHRFFAKYSNEKYVGFSDVDLICDVDGLMKLHKYNMDIKIIIIIRDQIDRAFSAYKFEKNKGVEYSKNFIEAIENDSRINKFGYINRSNYDYHINSCKTIIPEKNILILRFDDIRQDSSLALDDVCEFLGISKFNIVNSNKIYNESIKPKSMLLQRFLWKKNGLPGAIRFLFSYFPSDIKKLIKTQIIHKLRKVNTSKKQGSSEVLTPELRKIVQIHFHTVDMANHSD